MWSQVGSEEGEVYAGLTSGVKRLFPIYPWLKQIVLQNMFEKREDEKSFNENIKEIKVFINKH